MPTTLSSIRQQLDVIRQRLRESSEREWSPPTLFPPPEEPGRRRLSWAASTPEEKPRPMSLEEMREELVTTVREYVRGDEKEPLLVRVAAGGGKTYSGILIAQALAADGMRVMWAASRHSMFNELYLANDVFAGEQWYHWRPMDYVDPDGMPFCRHSDAQTVWMRRGYRSFALCGQLCRLDGHMSSCPYRAQGKVKLPIVFAMHEHLSSGIGIQKQFDVALVDELPMNAFLDVRRIPAHALKLEDATGPVQELGEKLTAIANGVDGYVSGRALFDQIGHTLTDVFAQIEINDNAIPAPPNIQRVDQVFDVPYFWIMRFLLIAEREWQCWRNGWDAWVERLRINDRELVMLWRKSPWPKLPQKLVALDATSRPAMYDKLFNCEPIMPEDDELPDDYEPPPLGFE